MFFGRKISFLALSIVCCSLPTVAPAQDYYLRTGVPDFDQRRDALPGDGSNYCVPTSYSNLLRYMAANGMPNQDLTYGTSYSSVTDFIARIGTEVGTSSSGGTNPITAWEKIRNWIWAHDSNRLVIQIFYGPNSDWGTGTMRNMLRIGAACKIGYGRYQLIDGKWDRGGGHAVTLVGFDYRSSTKKIIIRDPASDDGDLDAQGGYTYNNKTVLNGTYTTAEYGKVAHARYDLSWSGDNGDKRALVDTLHAVLPIYFGWSYSSDVSTSGQTTKIAVKTPWQFRNQIGTVPAEASWSSSEPVMDWCYVPGEYGIYALFGDGSVRKIDLLDNTEEKVASVPGARKIVVGGAFANLFFLGTNEKIDFVSRFDVRTGKLKSVNLPVRAFGIDTDEKGGGVVVMPNAMDRTFTFDELLSKTTIDLLPKLYSGSDLKIGMLFSVHHGTGEILLARRGSKFFDRIVRNGRIPAHDRQAPPLLMGIESLAPTEKGLIVLQDGGVLQTVGLKGELVSTQLSNQAADGSVRMPRTFQFAKASDFRDPGWGDVLPDGKNP
jgi:hypothetical protein